MRPIDWALLAALTVINIGATGVTLYETRVAREDFRAAAEPIGLMGQSIMDSLKKIMERDE